MSNVISQESVDGVVKQQSIAVVGVSRSETKFSRSVYDELKDKGYTVFPVNPNAERIGEDLCYPNLGAIPERIGAVLSLVPANQVMRVVREARTLDIGNVWIQQGVKTPEAIAYCHDNGINVVFGYCILMFAEPVQSFHKVHRFFARLFGAMPKKARSTA
jgi:predicted CoA-binding protein